MSRRNRNRAAGNYGANSGSPNSENAGDDEIGMNETEQDDTVVDGAQGASDDPALFPSDGRDHVAAALIVPVAGPKRHGAFAHHKGVTTDTFSIVHGGMTVDFRAHQTVNADDGLFDAIQEAGAPVIWE